METAPQDAVAVSPRLEQAIIELQGLHNMLLSGEDLDPRILTDFRDALNRLRNTAWSAQQYMTTRESHQDSTGVLSILAGERVRAAYQLCQTIEADLQGQEVKFQRGQLMQLDAAVKTLSVQLGKIVGKAE